MKNLWDMLWIEFCKALRSRIPLWVTLGALFMPLGVAFLIFVSKNPEISKKLGLISAKADLMSYAATDWTAYLALSSQMIAAGGFIFFVMLVAWTFGREFADGMIKDLLAVPVGRASIVLAKFIAAAAWSVLVTLVLLGASLAVGAFLRLPGASMPVIAQGSARMLVTAILTAAAVTPFALLASAGRGYLLPMGAAVLALMTANLSAVVGWGEYYPWSVAGLYSMAGSSLPAASYGIVFFTALAGGITTYLWWKYAEQSH